MSDSNEIKGNILFKALSDSNINYNKSKYPNLKKDDHQIIKSIYTSIEASVKSNIDLNYPDFNIKDISTIAILDTYLQQEHEIKLTKDEIEKIIKK